MELDINKAARECNSALREATMLPLGVCRMHGGKDVAVGGHMKRGSNRAGPFCFFVGGTWLRRHRSLSVRLPLKAALRETNRIVLTFISARAAARFVAQRCRLFTKLIAQRAQD